MSQEIRTSWAWGPDDGDDTPAAPPLAIEVDLDDEAGPSAPHHPVRPARLLAGLLAVGAAFAALAGTSPAGRDLVAGYVARLGSPAAAATGAAPALPAPQTAAAPSPTDGRPTDGRPADSRPTDGAEQARTDPRTGALIARGQGAKPNRMLSAGPAASPNRDDDRDSDDDSDGDGTRTSAPTPPAPLWTLLDDGTWFTAALAPADRPAAHADAVAVDLTLRTASLPSLAADADPADADPTPVTTDGRPGRVSALTLQGLGRLTPQRPLSTLSLPRAGTVVVPADLFADCTGWWTGPGQLRLRMTAAAQAAAGRVAGPSHVVAVSLPDRTPADVLTQACPAPRRGVALSLTRAHAIGPGRVQVRVVNHGSRPAALHLSPGWLDGQVALSTPGHPPVTLQPGHAVVLDIRVTPVTSAASSERGMRQGGRTGRSDPQRCHRLSVQLADAVSVQGSDPEDPDLGLVTAGDNAWGTDTFGHALSVAGLQCSPSGPSRS